MASNFVVVASGGEGLAAWDNLSAKAKRNMALAVNAAADKGRVEAAREMSTQINFPAKYLSGDRFGVTQKASAGSPEAVITARWRPTSLARFTNQTPTPPPPRTGKGEDTPAGVTVEVKPGLARFMAGAFLIKLKAGSADIDTNYNMGLAIRLRGRPLTGKNVSVKQIDKGLYLLYGPSVSQVFGGDRGVAEQVSGPVVDYLEKEFFRLMDVDFK